jgi:hypothetical protein
VKLYGRRPLTKLERGLYAALAAIFITIFASELLDYMELAERAAMEATLMNAVAAINVQAARDTLTSPKPGIDRSRNPFEMAGMAPMNFAGELHGSLPPAGSWGYDRASGELVYAPRLHFKLHTSNDESVLRFRLEPGPGAIQRVVPRAPYRWE